MDYALNGGGHLVMLDNINLFPWREWEAARYRKRFYQLSGAVIVSALVCQIWGGVKAHHHQQQLEEQRSLVEAQQAVLALQTKQLIQTQQQLETESQRYAQWVALQTDRQQSTVMLNLLSSWIPEGVYLDTLTWMDGRINVRGVSDNSAVVSILLDNLEQERRLHNIHLHALKHGVSRFNRSMVKFELSFDMRAVSSLGSIYEGKGHD